MLNLSGTHLGRVEKGIGGGATQKRAELGEQMGWKRVEKTRQEEKAQQATGADIYATPILHIISVPVATTMPSVFVQT